MMIHLFQNSNMWIVSMAVSDIMFAITLFFTTTGTVVHYKFNYNYMLAWMVYIGGVSYYSVLGLNLDRAYIVKYPFQANSRSKKTLRLAIMTCWLSPAFLALLYAFETTLSECSKHCHACWVAVDNVRADYDIIIC